MQRTIVLVVVMATMVVGGFACKSEEEPSGGGGAGTSAAGSPAAGSPAAGSPAAGSPAAGAGGGDMAMCISMFTGSGQSMECAMCACTTCATQATALGALTGDARTKADAVLTCGRENCCSGIACYCGMDLAACATAPMGAGPCAMQIEMAAGATGLAGITAPAGMPTNPLGAASGLGRCLTGDALMSIAGMCAACTPTCN